MSIKVVGFDLAPFNQGHCNAAGDRFIRAILSLQFSGNYAIGGDTLDLTNGGGSAAFPTCIPPAEVRGAALIDVSAMGPAGSLSAGNGEYRVLAPVAPPVPIASLNNLKMKVFQTNQSEYAAGAYAADVLTDVVQLEVVFAR